MDSQTSSAKPDFSQMEKAILKWWYENGVVKRYLHKNDEAKEKFFFLDGPITANNPMGVHHAWGRTLKDLYQRYHAMKGEAQRFQNGFDCQGLWVEVEVEKELGFKNKKDIEKYGLAKFVEKCKERVKKYAKIQTEQSKRLGYFMNWDNSYYTMSDENNYTIWHFLKKCHKKGLLYKGWDSVPWCPRCGTAISQHEILTEEYQEITHNSVIVKLKTNSSQDIYFLVWTTTPWTLPANVALAVNPKTTYVLLKPSKKLFKQDAAAKQLNNIFILAKSRLKILDGKYEIIKEIKGKELVGREYQGMFDELEAVRKTKACKFHKVMSADFVSEEEGTGIVHIAPGCGKEDYDLSKKENLPAIIPIDESGNYFPGFGKLSGKNVKNVNSLIFEYLEKNNQLVKIEKYLHRYPTCWRCKEELVFRLVEEWYISMNPLRQPLSKITKKIRWLPSWGKERELDWIKNMGDWLISKKRYWGLALSVWECSCGHFEVIGSKEELRLKAVAGWKEFSSHSPHRPWIDKVKIKCPKCHKSAGRITDVGNPWLDAGIVSFSTLIEPRTKKVSYLNDKKYWQRWFPADLVLECFPGQFKNWFYSLLAMAAVLENKPAFKTLFGHALVRDEKGEEMHKSKGNAIWFDEAVEKMGADVMRWMYARQNPVHNLNFGYHVADETRRRFHLILWNVYKFWQCPSRPNTNLHILDRWIISRLNQTMKATTHYLDNYNNYKAAEIIEKFVVNDLSGWYVRRSRERDCQKILGYVLTILCKILAPFIPFLTEKIWQSLYRVNTEENIPKWIAGQECPAYANTSSIHLQLWPKAGKVERKLISQMSLIRLICETGHAERKKLGIRVRQPLLNVKCQMSNVKSISNKQISNELMQLIKDELNVKEVIFQMSDISRQTLAVRHQTIDTFKLKFDTKITPELKAEGEARELIRKIQTARKKAGCRLDEWITVYAPQWPKNFEDFIKTKTLTKKLIKGKELKIKSH